MNSCLKRVVLSWWGGRLRQINVSRSGTRLRKPDCEDSLVCCMCPWNLNLPKKTKKENMSNVLKQVQPSPERLGSAFFHCSGFSLTQSDESNRGFVMDLASTIWVIDRTIGVEMGVGTHQGLPQGQFYYFRAEEAEIRKSSADYPTSSHNVN